MTLSLKQLVRRGFTTRQAQALIENTPEAPAAFPEHFANPTGDVAGLTGVLPHIFTNGSYWPTYGGLVTWDGTGPVKVETDDYAWYLRPASTPLTQAGFGAQALESATPGVYVAEYISNEPPTSFPDGWTAGNTTGAGPVLPYIGDGGGDYGYWAGLVYIAEGAAYNSNYSLFTPGPNVEMTFDYFDNTSDGLGGWPLPAGVYVMVAGDPITSLPAGWSFQPYGVGAAGPVLAALGEAVKAPRHLKDTDPSENNLGQSQFGVEAIGTRGFGTIHFTQADRWKNEDATTVGVDDEVMAWAATNSTLLTVKQAGWYQMMLGVNFTAPLSSGAKVEGPSGNTGWSSIVHVPAGSQMHYSKELFFAREGGESVQLAVTAHAGETAQISYAVVSLIPLDPSFKPPA